MEFISVQQAAANFGVTVRTVQKWAKEGKIEGAMRVGKAWLIPQNAIHPYEGANEQARSKGNQNSHTDIGGNVPLRLLGGDFAPGECLEYINKIEDKKIRDLTEAEYHYYKGNSEKCATIVETLLTDKEDNISISGSIMYAFACMSTGNYLVAKLAFSDFKKYFLSKEKEKTLIKEESIAILLATSAGVLLHSEKVNVEALKIAMPYLPKGLRMFGVFIQAYYAYLNGNYHRAIGMADAAIEMSSHMYLLPTIYLHLIAAIGLMNLRRTEEAEERFKKALGLAATEGFWTPFIELHGILLGLPEVCMKKEGYAAEYRYIASKFGAYRRGWGNVRKFGEEGEFADELSDIEFVISMLFLKDWSMKEIAAHLNISLRMVKQHLSTVYLKLGITRREELKKYLMK